MAPPADERLKAALAQEQAGNDTGALADLDARTRQDPGWALPRIESARIRLKRGEELDRAELDLEAASSLAPENPRAHYLLGVLMAERGRPPLAIAALERAVALKADYAEARQRLGALYFAGADWAKAEAQYRALAGVSDRLQLAAVLERQGRMSEAEAELKALYDAQPGSVVVARRLAELYDRTHRPKLAARVRANADPQTQRKLRQLKPSKH